MKILRSIRSWRCRSQQKCALLTASPALLSLQSYGRDDAKKTMVFLHGILGNKKNWRTPCSKFKSLDPDIRCIAIDLRGHGDSSGLMGANTLANCAVDLNATLKHYDIQPSVLCAHSFGGKVALSYLDLLQQTGGVKPPVTWILDSLPGPYPKEAMRSDSNSILGVLGALERVPNPIPSRDWFVKYMIGQNISKDIALWLATSITTRDGQLCFTFDLSTIKHLFDDFCSYDAWPVLENFQSSERVLYLRAGKNTAWTPSVISKFDSLANKNAIKLFTMPHVGHWMHSEDVNGFVDIIRVNTPL